MIKKLIKLLLIPVIPIFLLTGCAKDQATITTGSLFEEMINLLNLTSFPEPSYQTIQYSSYDHRSQLPGGPDWFANSDGFGGEPIPNFEKVLREPDEEGIGEYLIADVKGPGTIVRLWTAAISGTIRMYIDESDEPVYDGEAYEFLQAPYNQYKEMEEINTELFNKTIYQRDASYAPIPFAKRLRLIWTGNLKDIHFYQVQVRLYQEGTNMASFAPEDISMYKEAINHVSLVLSDPDKHFPAKSGETQKTFLATLKPSEKQDVLTLQGPQAIEKLTLQLRAEDIDKALRQTILHIIFDEHPWGQIQSPLGDFFGAAPGINPYQSLPFSVQPDGAMTCRFVMPFSKSMVLKIENRGDQEVTIKGTALSIPFEWDKQSMHFYARWRVDHNITASNTEVQDLPFLLANGKGLYVGTTSYLLNPAVVPTPNGNWWGEGDEKVFVDDDDQPSIFGTGSEDYYNYSWSVPDIFYFPYCGQPRDDGPGNRGFVTNYRWHILDPIPFKNSIRFYMELYSHETTPGLSYARFGYYYAKPGVTDDFSPIMPEDLRTVSLPPGWQPAARRGARNSEFFTAENILVNNQNTRLKKGALWEKNRIMIWSPKTMDERIDFSIPIRSTGNKRIYITAALTPKSGEFVVLLDNNPLVLPGNAETINLYRPYRILLRNFSFKPQELSEGVHTLSLIYKKSIDQLKDPEIGIDFIWVQNLDQ